MKHSYTNKKRVYCGIWRVHIQHKTINGKMISYLEERNLKKSIPFLTDLLLLVNMFFTNIIHQILVRVYKWRFDPVFVSYVGSTLSAIMHVIMRNGYE